MATKGTQSTNALAELIKKSQLGQAEKAAARRAKRGQKKPVAPVEAKTLPITGEEALHALFSKVRKVVAENHISREPSAIVGKSHELRRAMALHGMQACSNRIAEALMKSGYDQWQASGFASEAISFAI